MSWISIVKPSLLAYTNVNPGGKEQYDQSNLTYDEATVYYDGTNPNQWTEVVKPSVNGWTSVAKPS